MIALNQAEVKMPKIIRDTSITARVEEFTPDECEREVELNMGRQRKPSPVTIATLTRTLKNGDWMVNGETLIQDWDGNWIQGQHRFRAAARAGVPLRSVVVRGVDPACFATLDEHRKRTAAQVLTMNDESHATVVAGACRWHRALVKGKVADSSRWSMTNAETIAYLDRHPGLRASAAFVCSSDIDRLGHSYVVWTALHRRLCGVDAEAASDYVSKVLRGTGITDTDPEFVVRRRLLQSRGSDTPLRPGAVLLAAIIGWNARRKGTAIRKIILVKKDSNEIRPLPQIAT